MHIKNVYFRILHSTTTNFTLCNNIFKKRRVVKKTVFALDDIQREIVLFVVMKDTYLFGSLGWPVMRIANFSCWIKIWNEIRKYEEYMINNLNNIFSNLFLFYSLYFGKNSHTLYSFKTVFYQLLVNGLFLCISFIMFV